MQLTKYKRCEKDQSQTLEKYGVFSNLVGVAVLVQDPFC